MNITERQCGSVMLEAIISIAILGFATFAANKTLNNSRTQKSFVTLKEVFTEYEGVVKQVTFAEYQDFLFESLGDCSKIGSELQADRALPEFFLQPKSLGGMTFKKEQDFPAPFAELKSNQTIYNHFKNNCLSSVHRRDVYDVQGRVISFTGGTIRLCAQLDFSELERSSYISPNHPVFIYSELDLRDLDTHANLSCSDFKNMIANEGPDSVFAYHRYEMLFVGARGDTVKMHRGVDIIAASQLYGIPDDGGGDAPRQLTADIRAIDPTGDAQVSVAAGEVVTLAWTSTNATDCSVQPSGWTGLSNPAQDTPAISGPITYTLTCNGPGGPVSDSIDILVSGSLLADLKVNGDDGPATIQSGQSATLSWTSSLASSCAVTPGGWTGLASAGQATGNLMADTTYTLTCQGPGGPFSDSVDVIVQPASQPLSADLKVNGSDGPVNTATGSTVRLTWTSSGATDCSVSPIAPPGLSGLNETAGRPVGPITNDVTFTLTCTGLAGTATDMVDVKPVLLAAPTADLKINASDGPVTVNEGTQVTASWTSTNADSCALSPSGLFGTNNPVGSLVSPGNSDMTFTLVCTNASGSASDSVDVQVTPVVQIPETTDFYMHSTMIYNTNEPYNDPMMVFGIKWPEEPQCYNVFDTNMTQVSRDNVFCNPLPPGPALSANAVWTTLRIAQYFSTVPEGGTDYKLCNADLSLCSATRQFDVAYFQMHSIRIINDEVHMRYSTNSLLVTTPTKGFPGLYEGWSSTVTFKELATNETAVFPLSDFNQGFGVGSEVYVGIPARPSSVAFGPWTVTGSGGRPPPPPPPSNPSCGAADGQAFPATSTTSSVRSAGPCGTNSQLYNNQITRATSGGADSWSWQCALSSNTNRRTSCSATIQAAGPTCSVPNDPVRTIYPDTSGLCGTNHGKTFTPDSMFMREPAVPNNCSSAAMGNANAFSQALTENGTWDHMFVWNCYSATVSAYCYAYKTCSGNPPRTTGVKAEPVTLCGSAHNGFAGRINQNAHLPGACRYGAVLDGGKWIDNSSQPNKLRWRCRHDMVGYKSACEATLMD